MYDDNGHECTGQTQLHNPFAGEDSLESKNWAVGSRIIFNESFLFLRNFPILFEKNDLPIYLVIKIVEKPKPIDILDPNKVSFRDNKKENFGNLEFETVAWINFELTETDGKIKTGWFTYKTNNGPYKMPLFDKNENNQFHLQTDFSVNVYEYDMRDL